MYELKSGTERLARALHDASFSDAQLKRLARILNYHEPQLGDDIRAMYDRCVMNKEVPKEQ